MSKLFPKVLCLLTCLPIGASAQLLPLGATFQVSTGTATDASQPAAASDPAGNFMIVWMSSDTPAPVGILGRVYDAAGTAQGSELQVTPDQGLNPAVAAAGTETFLVVWALGPNVLGRVYNADSAHGEAFSIGGRTDEGGNDPGVACNASGDCVVVWQLDMNRIGGRRFDRNGLAQGDEFEVTSGDAVQYFPHAAVDDSGNFVVVWQRFSTDPASSAVMAQRYDRTGAPAGTSFNVATTENQFAIDASAVAVTTDPSGTFFVTWDSQINALASPFAPMPGNIFARRYDDTGAALSPPTQITTQQTYLGFYPAVASDASGNVLLAWREINLGATERISAQYFSADGAPSGPVFQVTSSNKTTDTVAVASAAQGAAVVTWDSNRRIYAQRYQAASTPTPTRTPTSSTTSTPAATDNNGGCNLAPHQSSGSRTSAVLLVPALLVWFRRCFTGRLRPRWLHSPRVASAPARR